MIDFSFLEFLPQCCDAQDYLHYGRLCASGQCVVELRTVGTLFWFSLPYRFGLPPESLILLQSALTVLSAYLASRVALREFGRFGQTLPRIWRVMLFLVSLFIHGFFFLPVLRHSLSDAPAGSLLMIGLWCWLLASTANRRSLWYLLAGLCLGLAAWLRPFYLYPVLLTLTLIVPIALWRRKWPLLGLLVALLPIALQFHIVYQHYGYWSYLEKSQSNAWVAQHLQSHLIGYDSNIAHTVGNVGEGYGWVSACSKASGGVYHAWQQKNWQGVLCTFADRAHFYLGSYLPTNYLTPAPGFVYPNNILTHYERLDNLWVWWQQNLEIKADVALSPRHQQEAEKLRVVAANTAGTAAAIYQTIGYRPLEVAPYTFSAWLWSSLPRTVTLGIYSSHPQLAAQRSVLLTTTPTRYELTFTPTAQQGLHIIALGALEGVPVDFGRQPDDYFYAWGLQFHKGTPAAHYDPEPLLDRQRHWSVTLLMINLAAIMMAVLFLVQSPTHWSEKLAWLSLPAAVAGLSLLIIPEQRFAIAFLVLCWQLALIVIVKFFRKIPAYG